MFYSSCVSVSGVCASYARVLHTSAFIIAVVYISFICIVPVKGYASAVNFYDDLAEIALEKGYNNIVFSIHWNLCIVDTINCNRSKCPDYHRGVFVTGCHD